MEGDDVMNTRLAIKESLKKLEEYASYLRYIYSYIPNINAVILVNLCLFNIIIDLIESLRLQVNRYVNLLVK